MNARILYILLAFAVSMQYACKKTLESEPLDQLTEDLVFDGIDKNADNAKSFLYGIYQVLPNIYNRVDNAFLDASTDDGVASMNSNQTDYFRNGRISALSVVDNVWAANYSGIRRANVFLSKIDRVPTTAANKTSWKAEARFLRAFFYFELVKRWGGVPLLGNKVLGIHDNLNLERASLESSLAYIKAELADIRDSLINPASMANGDVGRATKGAAMALLSRVLLYEASPLYNPSNDLNKWTAAADAAKAVMNLNVYNLNSDFIALFNANKNSEIIFARESTTNKNVETSNGPIGYTATTTTGYGYTSPSQGLVDAFPMKSGLPITDATAGYDPAAPYLNRDPRLDATIMYNGKKWLGRPVETFEGGLDKPGGTLTQTKTGYYLRKFMGKFESSTAYSNTQHNSLLFRYAEILLNYAEALNEASGPVKEVYDALALIRKRAGITAGSNNLYGLPAAASQAEMRNIIRNERRIELAFEEHRFWDIRRWKIAGSVMGQPVKGMRIIKQADGTFTYTVFDVTPSVFDESKMYWLPVPYSEIETNPNMEQNPGWSF